MSQLIEQLGIIPAYAGNTLRIPFVGWLFGDHPRVCGEHVLEDLTITLARGSSPRMRGTRRVVGVVVPVDGIIPAYAGNTPSLHPFVERWGDHPRVCGEHMRATCSSILVSGSSPRMRGTPDGESGKGQKPGIIPAYAGNTRLSRSPCRQDGGSSPRMRGTHHRDVDSRFQGGIIPAYAGNTMSYLVSFRYCGDHPRVCGEHLGSLAKSVSLRGSSPRMRGTPTGPQWPTPTTGIIPAYAGNTLLGCRAGRGRVDHPRVCGEHKHGKHKHTTEQGSSPRMRGTH